MSAPVAVVGGGSIGVAWALVFARAGHVVAVHDVDEQRRAAVPGEVRDRLEALAAHGLLDDDVRAVSERVGVVDSLDDAVRGCDYVQECVLESELVKRELFAELDALTAPDTILASSSSMMPASRFAAELAGRQRCLVVHPGNPPYLLPVAEVVPAPFTSDDVVQRTRHLLMEAGMTPVLVQSEVEGFVFNRLQGALLREAYRLVRDGVATAADVDAVVSLGLGRRWAVLGPFATAELNTRGGLEQHARLMGPAYLRMGAEHGEREEWPPELVAEVAGSIHERLPSSLWEEHVRRRDEELMTLQAARHRPAHPAAGPAESPEE